MILFTSGTTADPKGVVLTHGNLAAERESAFAVVDVSERDAVLGILPLFHSLAQMANLLLPMAVGARVVYLETLNTTELLKGLAERHITIFVCVPQFFYLIHQRVTGEVQKGGWLTRTAFRALLSANLTLRRVGRQHRPDGLRQGAQGAGRSHPPADHRRLEVRSGRRPGSLRPRLHHPAGLRADRDLGRRHHHQARRGPHRHRRAGCCPATS